jgi:signal transduction histidine kinase
MPQIAQDAAHDLKNQLAVIIGFCELKNHPESASRIRDAAARCLKILENFCAATLIAASEEAPTKEAGASPNAASVLSSEPAVPAAFFNLNHIALSVFDAAQNGAHRARIEMLMDLESGGNGFKIRGDSLEMHRALLNLTLNAIAAVLRSQKDIPGKITIATELAGGGFTMGGREPGRPYVILSVTDNGIGILPEKLLTVWEHVPAPGDVHGRGLSIVKSAVAHMGGKVTVESEPAFGTVFKIYLPIAA